jgi:hypothetical protein
MKEGFIGRERRKNPSRLVCFQLQELGRQADCFRPPYHAGAEQGWLTPTALASQGLTAAAFLEADAVSTPPWVREGGIRGLRAFACAVVSTTSGKLVMVVVRLSGTADQVLRFSSGADCSIGLGDL